MCTAYLTVCFYHITYTFQSESTLHSCVNVKELFAPCNHLKASDFQPPSSKEFLNIQAALECGFTLKRVRDMIQIYSQRKQLVCLNHWTYKYLSLFVLLKISLYRFLFRLYEVSLWLALIMSVYHKSSFHDFIRLGINRW